MMIFRQIVIASFLFLVVLSTPSVASLFEWQVMEGENYRLYYHPKNKAKALEAYNELELARPFVERRVGNLPKIMPIVLEEKGQASNGMVRLMPLRMNLFTEYPSQHPFRQTQYFLRLLTTHELVHAAHITEVSGLPKQLTYWLGDIFYSNIYSPRWYLEGLAVSIESQITEFDGRLNDPYQEAYFAYHASQKSLKSLGQMSFPMYTYLMGSTPYVYGGRFVDYIDKTFGNASTRSFIKSYGRNPLAISSILSPGFAFEDDMKSVYKASTKKLYNTWRKSEESTYSSWKINGEKISESGWYKQALLPYKNGIISQETVMHHPGPFIYNPVHQIVRYTPSGKAEVLLKSSRGFTAVPALVNDTLYISRQYVKRKYENILYKGYGVTSQLTQVNLKTGKKQARFVGDVTAFEANELGELFIAVREPGHYTTQLLRVSDDEQTLLTELPYAISEMELKNDALYMVAKDTTGPWSLYVLSLKTLELTSIVSSPWSVYGLTVSEKGLTFTSNHNKTRHLYEWDMVSKKTVKISSGNDASLGVKSNGNLYFVSFSEKGEDIYVSSPEETESDLEVSYKTLPKATPISTSTSSSALSTSLKSLKNPSIKLVPILYDEDDLGLIQYSTSYSSFSGLNISVMSHHLRPVSVGVVHQFGETYGVVQSPLYRSATHRLLGLTGGVLSDFGSSNQLQLIGMSDSRLGQLQTDWRKDVDDDEVLLKIDGSLYLGSKSSLNVAYTSSEGITYYDFLRGYHYWSMTDVVGHTVRWDLKRKLVDINQGLWIPPVAAGSVFVGAFSDYSSYFDKQARGAYVSFETKALLFELPMVMSFGQSYLDDESRGFITLEIGGVF